MGPRLISYNGKLICIGKSIPTLATLQDNTYIVTGNAWHKVSANTQYDNLQYQEQFEYFMAWHTPRNFEEWQLHKDCLNTDKHYKAYFELFCKQQYKQAYPDTWWMEIDMQDAELDLPCVSYRQLYEMRHAIQVKQQPTRFIVKQFQSSRGNELYTVSVDTYDMQATCTCKGFIYNHKCKHITQTLQTLQAQ